MGSLLAGYLLQCAVKEVLGSHTAAGRAPEEGPLVLAYRYGTHGKPYLADYPDLYFNLSHSGRYAVCGISDREIGVDIQEEQTVEDRLAERFFTAGEYEELRKLDNDRERKRLFFRLWTVKESYMKLNGKGLSQGLDSFRIDWGKGRVEDRTAARPAWFEEWEEAPGVYMAVCGYEPGGGKEVIYM
jgi:4'-phosphopantetheinyl transferase